MLYSQQIKKKKKVGSFTKFQFHNILHFIQSIALLLQPLQMTIGEWPKGSVYSQLSHSPACCFCALFLALLVRESFIVPSRVNLQVTETEYFEDTFNFLGGSSFLSVLVTDQLINIL